jgi:hypothetical protein
MTEITRPFAPAPDKSTQTGKEFAKDKKTRVYYFPRRVLLQLPNLERVMFEMGPQEVPEEILEHAPSMKWLADNGAKPHVVEHAPAKLERMPEITDHHVRFLQQRGYVSVKTVADAIRFVTSMKEEEKPGFFAEAAEWRGPISNDALGQDSASSDAGEDPNAAPQTDDKPADDKPADKAISAGTGGTAHVPDRSKAAAQGGSHGKSSGKHK